MSLNRAHNGDKPQELRFAPGESRRFRYESFPKKNPNVEVFARALPTFQNLLASLRAHDHHIQEYSSGVFPTSKESRDNDVRDVFISSKVVHGVKTGLKERKAERGDCFGTIEELAE